MIEEQQQEDQEIIDYKFNEKILSVSPLDEDNYHIVSASVHGILLEKQEIRDLFKLTTGNADDYQETKSYDEEFIECLRNVFFNLYQSQTPTSHHIPILLSIEGNIGAGKSSIH